MSAIDSVLQFIVNKTIVDGRVNKPEKNGSFDFDNNSLTPKVIAICNNIYVVFGEKPNILKGGYSFLDKGFDPQDNKTISGMVRLWDWGDCDPKWLFWYQDNVLRIEMC